MTPEECATERFARIRAGRVCLCWPGRLVVVREARGEEYFDPDEKAEKGVLKQFTLAPLEPAGEFGRMCAQDFTFTRMPIKFRKAALLVWSLDDLAPRALMRELQVWMLDRRPKSERTPPRSAV